MMSAKNPGFYSDTAARVDGVKMIKKNACYPHWFTRHASAPLRFIFHNWCWSFSQKPQAVIVLEGRVDSCRDGTIQPPVILIGLSIILTPRHGELNDQQIQQNYPHVKSIGLLQNPLSSLQSPLSSLLSSLSSYYPRSKTAPYFDTTIEMAMNRWVWVICSPSPNIIS